MTIAEMHTAVKLGLDKSSGLQLPAFEPEEIDYWLNKEILLFIKTRAFGRNLSGESFEQTQKRIDDLRTIVKELRVTVLTAGGVSDKPNSYLVDLPTTVTDYLFGMGEEVEIVYNGVISRQGVTECTSEAYTHFIDNPYSEHHIHYGKAKPLRLYKLNSVELVSDGNYTITKYFLNYLKQPAVVSIVSVPNVSCDLPSHTHQEIVDMTVAALLENIESNRYQGFKTETSVSE